MKRSPSGQALMEWAILLPLYTGLFAVMAAFGQYFAVRHQLIAAAREGAFLYSSGRLTADEARVEIQESLRKGFPAMNVSDDRIFIGRRSGVQARMFRLDEVRVVYPASSVMKAFRLKDMEETCVIQHAPSYWQTVIPGANLGPPVSW
jgi:hypothetical protein